RPAAPRPASRVAVDTTTAGRCRPTHRPGLWPHRPPVRYCATASSRPVQRDTLGGTSTGPGLPSLSHLERVVMPSIHCSVCELTGEPASLLEAEWWAAIHDQLQHRGHPTVAILERRRFLPRTRRRPVTNSAT